MASTFSTNLALELIGTGDQAGTWGVTTNTNLGTLVEQAISGYVTQAVSTGADTTITIPNGATGVARNMYIELTGTGGTNTNLIVPSNKKLYFIFNNTSSGQVTVKVSGQTGVSVPNGKKVVLVCNGTDIVNGLNYIADFGTNSFTVTNLTATSATITNLIATTASISDASATVLRSASATITNLIATSASITTLTNNPTFSAGTANGVLYLNGSKVATSGSALQFSGTKLSLSAAGGADFVGVFTNTTAATPYILRVQEPATPTSGYPLFDVVNNAGSTAYLRVDSGTGNVGIGTASPSTKLHVVNDTAATNSAVDVLTLTQSSTGTAASGLGAGILFQSERPSGGVILKRGAIYGVAGAVDPNDDGDLAFYTLTDTGPSGFTEKMRLDSSGNLGIGTASPATKLHVYSGSGATSLKVQRTTVPTYLTDCATGASNAASVWSVNIQNTSNGSSSWASPDNSVYSCAAVTLDVPTAGSNILFSTASAVNTAPTERGRFSAGGDFLVGTSTTTTGVSTAETSIVARGKDATNTSASFVTVTNDGVGSGYFGTSGTTGETFVSSKSNHALVFGTNATERARITDGGKFLLNTTSTVASADEIFGAIGASGLGVKSTGGASSFVAAFWNNATSGDNVFVNFYTETGGTNRGSITYNRTGGLVAYNTTSDYRAKDVYGLLDDSGETIDALKVYRGKMHGATMERPMLIAHEAQEIAPYAVTGEKDAVNDDGTPKFQQMDTSSLVPLLIAEIQSLRSRVAALESK